MSTTSPHLDIAQEIKYPVAGDRRRSTRIYFQKTAYYFGPYESPVSYVTFGLWKQQLIDSGKAPNATQLRSIAERFLKPEKLKRPARFGKKRVLLASLVFSVVCLIISGVVAAKILSTSAGAEVDGLVLTGVEMDLIRGYRDSNLALTTVKEKASLHSDRVAILTRKFRDEELGNGIPPHRLRKGF